MDYRNLTDQQVPALAAAFARAFADYSVPMQMSEEQLRRHLQHNGVRLDLSVGAWSDGTLAGFILNGIGEWKGRLTAYDAGTGVVPEHRGHGVAGELLRAAIPALKAAGVEQYLLEVIQTNAAALKVYRGLGFRVTRELDCLGCPPERRMPHEPRQGTCEVRAVDAPDWPALRAFWDWEPSWQNSIAALERRAGTYTLLGAYAGESCVGYAVVTPGGGLPQLAVDRAWRRRRIGQQLLDAAWETLAPERSLTVINVDALARDTLVFLTAQGFESFTRQDEMIMEL